MSEPAKVARGDVVPPLRIVVAGNSASLFCVPARERHCDGVYGEHLPRLLAAEGLPAEVFHTGQWYGKVDDLRRRYESAVRGLFPTVLVLHFGMAECMPNVVPTWMSRHFQTWDRSSHPVARAYREKVAPPVWLRLREVQRRAARLPTYRLSPDRYAVELQKVITMARDETGCLVLLPDIDPPGPRVEHWMPSMTDRRDLFQDVQDGVVAAYGDDVRSVRIAHHLEEHGFEAAMPDGLHRSAFGHRLAAEAVVAEILDWLAA